MREDDLEFYKRKMDNNIISIFLSILAIAFLIIFGYHNINWHPMDSQSAAIFWTLGCFSCIPFSNLICNLEWYSLNKISLEGTIRILRAEERVLILAHQLREQRKGCI